MISSVRPFLFDRPFGQKLLFAFLLGLLSVGALPPLEIWPLAFVALSFFFLILDQTETKKSAFLVGWAYGIGFFGGGLYWLTNAFLVNSDQHAWMIPIALPLLSAFVGLFIALSSLLTFQLGRFVKKDAQVIVRILVFATLWMIFEWLRSWIFTGFPWNMMGTIWAASDVMLQSAALFGAFGLSFVTVFGATLIAGAFYFSGAKRVVVIGCTFGLVLSLYEYGAWRLSGVQIENHEGVFLRLVQPNIPQNEKWLAEKRNSNFNKLLELSVTKNLPENQRPTHIIWPETAVTFPVNRDAKVRSILSQLSPIGGSIIVGSPLMSKAGEKPFRVWNSLIAIDDQAQSVGRYDKSHLVPFGEYVPFRNILPIGKITAGKVDFTKGLGLETLTLPGLPAFSPLICYEVIFPNNVINENTRPQWLLNLTNDGWYGDTPGPYQHALSARMRSIEEGLPLVRVANTGISFVTDAYGRVQAELPYGVSNYIDFSLSKPLSERPVGGQYMLWIMGIIVLMTSLVFFWSLKRPHSLSTTN